MKATDWRWEKSRKCEKQEMEAPAAFQNKMKYRLETAELEIFEGNDFVAIMDEYYRCVERKVRATLYKAGKVFMEYIPERYV